MMPRMARMTVTIKTMTTGVRADVRETFGGGPCFSSSGAWVTVCFDCSSAFIALSPYAPLARCSVEFVGFCWLIGLNLTICPRVHGRRIFAVHKGEENRDEGQGPEGREQETSDDGAAKRCVLLAAVAQSQGHRHHADHHRQRRHDDRAKAGEARGECSVH